MFIKCKDNPIINTYNVMDIDKLEDKKIVFYKDRTNSGSLWILPSEAIRNQVFEVLCKVLKVRDL